MNSNRFTDLKRLEGCQVTLALRDGSRIESCHLVSAGGNRVGTLWLVSNDADTFVALDQVVAVQPALPRSQTPFDREAAA
jgi:hypothetical protein